MKTKTTKLYRFRWSKHIDASAIAEVLEVMQLEFEEERYNKLSKYARYCFEEIEND